jgi:hypothetical protein
MSDPTPRPADTPAGGPGPLPPLDAALQAQRADWARGEHRPVESYLEAWPALRADPEALLDLIYSEALLRRAAGEHPQARDYAGRFPELADDLDRQFAIAALCDEASDQGETTPHAPGPGGAGLPPPAVPGYELSELLGRGGMGTVFQGYDITLERDVAVKVLREELQGAEGLARRFVEEARIGGRLQHPGVVPVYALGRLPDARPFIAMKLVKGQTLATLLAQRPSPTAELPRLLAVFEQACQAVAYAHSKGVVHRNLKPANVMVGAFGEVQVMDWGVAKALSAKEGYPPDAPARERHQPDAPARDTPAGDPPSSPATQQGTVLGTPAYMAPEQARGEAVDERADVFGLGAILCEILTGAPPYPQTRHRTAEDLTAAWSRLAACGADGELVGLARACLAPEREQRPRDPGAVAQALAAHQASVQQRLRAAELERAAAQARAAEARAKVAAERRARRLTAGLAAALLLALSAGGAAFHLKQRQAEAGAERARLVEADLGEVAEQRRLGRADRAWEALERAEGRLTGSGDAGLAGRLRGVREQLRRERRDRDMLAAVEKARLHTLTTGKGGEADRAEQDRLFRQAFAGYGLDLEALSPEEAARRVGASAIAEPLLAALDDWAWKIAGGQLKARVRRVAHLVDPDPWRRRLRRAMYKNDRETIRKLLRGPLPARLSPSAVVLLAVASKITEDRKRSSGCCARPSGATRATCGCAINWGSPPSSAPATVRRRCATSPRRWPCRRTAPPFATSWPVPWASRSGGPRRWPSCGRPSGSSPALPWPTTTWATPCTSKTSCPRRPPPTGRRLPATRSTPRPTTVSARSWWR